MDVVLLYFLSSFLKKYHKVMTKWWVSEQTVRTVERLTVRWCRDTVAMFPKKSAINKAQRIGPSLEKADLYQSSSGQFS